MTDHSHSHAVSREADQKRLGIALGLIVSLMVGEVIAGILASSLALLSDAGHLLTDAGALTLSLLAMRWARLPARGAFTFGFKRSEILAAQINGLTLLLIAALITVEAVRRFIEPPEVHGATMLVVAAVGIMVNIAAVWQMAKANRQSLNVEGSFKHIVTDLYAFIGTGIAAMVILTTGFDRADPMASLVVVLLMTRSGVDLLRASGRVFLEAAPQGLHPAEITNALEEHPSVTDVHDFHLWEVTSGFPALAAHVLVRPTADCHAVRRELERIIGEKFRISHTTLQVDHDESERVHNIGGITATTAKER